MMASLISFAVGFIILLLMKIITNKNFQMDTNHTTYGKLKPFYFIGGALGVIFITVNIYLMPHVGAALTTVAGVLGQMIMALIIDHFGLLGSPKNKITTRKELRIMIIIAGISCLRFFYSLCTAVKMKKEIISIDEGTIRNDFFFIIYSLNAKCIRCCFISKNRMDGLFVRNTPLPFIHFLTVIIDKVFRYFIAFIAVNKNSFHCIFFIFFSPVFRHSCSNGVRGRMFLFKLLIKD